MGDPISERFPQSSEGFVIYWWFLKHLKVSYDNNKVWVSVILEVINFLEKLMPGFHTRSTVMGVNRMSLERKCWLQLLGLPSETDLSLGAEVDSTSNMVRKSCHLEESYNHQYTVLVSIIKPTFRYLACKYLPNSSSSTGSKVEGPLSPSWPYNLVTMLLYYLLY